MTETAGERGAPAPAAAVLPPAIGLHGAVVAFNPDQEDWSEYVERLEHYFTANDIVSSDKRRAILLNAVGASTYRLIRAPAKVTDFSFQDLVEKAQANFNPKPSPIVKRYEFNTRRQGEGEAIATYVAELRKIAEYCDYGAVLNDMLRDRLVCGTHNKSIQRRLLQETKLKFEAALEMALSAEAADKDSKRLTSSSSDKDLPTLQIGQIEDHPSTRSTAGRGYYRCKSNKSRQHSGGKQQGSRNSGKQECYRCGGGQHDSTDCPFKQYECHFCHKKGHLAKVCRQKKKGHNSPDRAHHVTGEVESEEMEEYSMHHVTSGQARPLHVTVTVNGSPLSMEVDTGASVSITSLETFKSIQEGESRLELKESMVKLQTYTGESIRVCGSTIVSVAHNGHCH